MSPRRNWDSPGVPPPLSPPSVTLPSEPKGGAHAPAGEGLGKSQFRRLEKKLSTLPTLWFKILKIAKKENSLLAKSLQKAKSGCDKSTLTNSFACRSSTDCLQLFRLSSTAPPSSTCLYFLLYISVTLVLLLSQHGCSGSACDIWWKLEGGGGCWMGGGGI